MGAFHRGLWICGHPDCLSDPSRSPPWPRESHPLCGLLLLPLGPVIPEGLPWHWRLKQRRHSVALLYLHPLSPGHPPCRFVWSWSRFFMVVAVFISSLSIFNLFLSFLWRCDVRQHQKVCECSVTQHYRISLSCTNSFCRRKVDRSVRTISTVTHLLAILNVSNNMDFHSSTVLRLGWLISNPLTPFSVIFQRQTLDLPFTSLLDPPLSPMKSARWWLWKNVRANSVKLAVITVLSSAVSLF